MDNTTTPSPQTSLPSPPKPERGSSSYLAVFAVTLSLLSIAVAGFSLEALRNAPQQPVEDEASRAALKSQQARIAKLEQSLLEANSTIDSLKSDWDEKANAPEAEPVDTAAMEASLDEVKDELAASQDAIAQNIAQLDTRIGELAQTKQQEDVRLTYGLLRARVESGKPYGDALALLEQALDNTPQEQDMSPLSAHSAEGIATLGKLYADMQAITITPADIVVQDAPADGSWWKQTRASISGLVKVERIQGEVAPDVAHETILHTVKLGDIAAARSAILALPSRDQRPYEAWLDISKARIDTLDALDALASAVLAKSQKTPAVPASEAESTDASATPTTPVSEE